jgi:hypothetical protein
MGCQGDIGGCIIAKAFGKGSIGKIREREYDHLVF